MNDNYQSIIDLRAIRDYEQVPLREADLDAILHAARWTGSSKNLQNWAFIVVQDEDQLAKLAECGDYTVPVENSAATIVLVVEPDGYVFDSGRVAQNIMLAADAIGVASCPITLHRDQDAASLLGLTADQSCRFAVALGYPADGASAKKFGGRKTMTELVHWEQY
ncbi:MAG: nitroreductase [bacterium]|nr:nitroreductase [bacterium]MCP4964232.1 nitroreductase [bacterium]